MLSYLVEFLRNRSKQRRALLLSKVNSLKNQYIPVPAGKVCFVVKAGYRLALKKRPWLIKLPIDEMLSWVSQEDYQRMEQEPPSVSDLPVLAGWTYDGKYKLLDGHHRAIAAKKNGQSYIKGYVLTEEEFASCCFHTTDFSWVINQATGEPMNVGI
ncbi:MAG: hypothetical protein U1G07_05850 [Verrucomicrobiota bacterium]